MCITIYLGNERGPVGGQYDDPHNSVIPFPSTNINSSPHTHTHTRTRTRTHTHTQTQTQIMNFLQTSFFLSRH
jgi:carbohydrate-binding DOMON domain-containing protein